ncbi:MAG: type II toxin-antitoxin system prevent-host-death family antitoxin [Dehalococcoidia bacterium]|nr:type II toxin-antitoxin system prevent-host-death family antitoxin [Dehalococcoidia bacterium]
MTKVGITELKTRTSEIIRRVRDANETFLITHRGRPVARLRPIEGAKTEQYETSEILAEMDRLAEEITKHWPEGVSAVDAVREVRREL